MPLETSPITSSDILAVKAVLAEAMSAFRPPPRQTVSEWADAHRILDSSSPEPGEWRTARTPYLRDIMDALSASSPYENIIFKKGAQIGGTEVLLNFTGYLMHHSPAPTLLVQPTSEMAKRFSKQRLASLIENTPVLRNTVKDPRSRDSGNTVLMKEFRGGVLVITGANSAVGLRSLPAKNVIADELDGWKADVDGEGDPFNLAVKRSAAFGSKRKIYACSTPTREGFSRIDTLYKQSDQRQFYVPCPGCRYFQVLTWKQMRWTEDNPETARYECVSCKRLIQNHEKTGMLSQGEYRPQATGDGKTIGFHVSALYAPVGWLSWPELVREYLAARQAPDTEQVFVNTVLGECWSDEDTTEFESGTLYLRRETYPAEVPRKAVLLTCGVDVQNDRFELEVVGWGRDEESWSVGYFSIQGDPSGPDIWGELDRILNRQWRHESGLLLPISATCMDSGGHHTQAVYQFCWPRIGRRVWAIKGAGGFGRPIFPRKASKGMDRTPVFVLGVDVAKDKTWSMIRITEPGPGYCHFPDLPSYDPTYFAMLTSERVGTRLKNGIPERFYFLPPRARNEAFDCRNYNLAALHGLYQSGLNLNEMCSEFESKLAGVAPAEGYQVAKSSFLRR